MNDYPIKCPFCVLVDLIYVARVNGFMSGNVPKTHCNMYYCHDCKSSIFHENNEFIGWTFKREYNGNEYQITWFEENKNTTIRKNWKVITTFSGKANLTPNNLVGKIPTILTFL